MAEVNPYKQVALRALEFLEPYLDGDPRATPDWAIQLARILVGREPGALPPAQGPLQESVQALLDSQFSAKHWKNEAARLRVDRDQWRRRAQKAEAYADQNVWFWQGDDNDFPGSMANDMVVVIRADQLRVLIDDKEMLGGAIAADRGSMPCLSILDDFGHLPTPNVVAGPNEQSAASDREQLP